MILHERSEKLVVDSLDYTDSEELNRFSLF